MRKLLFIAVAFFLAISAGAQTIDSPLKLELGRNLLDNPWSEDEIYYSYTAPADQEVTVLCTRTWEFYTRAMKCNADGSHTALDYYNGFDKAMGSATTIFRVKGGEKYLVAISTDASISQVPFTVAVEAMPYDLGMSCGTPMQLGDEAVCMPLGYSAVNGFTPVYGTFTPDHDCTIELVTDWLPMHISCATSCDGEWVDVPLNPISTSRKWQIAGKKNQKYIFRVEGTTPTMIWAYAMDYVRGESCEFPLEAVAGKNVLPAAAGTYFFVVKAPRLKPDAPDNFIEVTAKDDVAVSSVTFMSVCDDPDAYKVEGVMALRHRVISNQYCVIRIVRSTAADAPQVFDVKFNSEQPYDDFYSAPFVLSGFEDETPQYAGTYYYSITAPAEEGLILNVKSDYVPSGGEVSVKLAGTYLGPNYIYAEGTTSLSYNGVTPGAKYVIIWSSTNANRSIPFTASFEKAAQGDTEVWPLDAVLGTNNLDAGQNKFYSFKATEDGWLKIAPSQMSILSRVKVTDSDGTRGVAAFPRDGFYQVAATKGLTYTMIFADVPDAASFTLSQAPFGTGDTFDLAEEVTGDFILNKPAGLYWYKYTAPSDGVVNVSTDLAFGFGSGTIEGTMSGVAVYVNTPDNYTLLNPNYFTFTLDPAQVAVAKGDVVYLEVGVIETVKGIHLNIGTAEAKPGETYRNPIVIENCGDPTDYVFTQIDYTSKGVWYSIELSPGVLEMAAPAPLLLDLYASDNLNRPITRGGYIDYDIEADEELYGFGFDNEYYPAAQIVTAGTYLLCVKMMDECVATFFGTALGKAGGVGSAVAEGVSVTTAPGMLTVTGADTVDVYDIAGARVASGTDRKGTATTVNLPAGIYIVRADAKVVKVRL